MMDNRVIYKLKMFSSLLVSNPEVKFDGMHITMELKGYDDEDNYSECSIKFVSVIGYTYTLSGFDMIKGSYDTIVEVLDSEWKAKFQKTNNDKFAFWKPNHYALYLDEVGLYQVLASDVIVEEKMK